MHSSQNEQDNRFYARFAGVPVLDPSDSREAKEFTKLAFRLSEEFDTPVLLRSTTRVSHCRGVVELEPAEEPPAFRFERDPRKYVMLPGHARLRHPLVLDRIERLAAWAEESRLTVWEERDPAIGVLTSSIVYQYVREALPEASVLKLGMTYPLPLERIRAFAASVDRLFVVEELEPFLEDALRAEGIGVVGKELFPRLGELSPDLVRAGFVEAGVLEPVPAPIAPGAPPEPSPRPPVLCPGCSHATPFMALKQLGAVVAGDIGCYTLAALEPLSAMDTSIAMGSSIGMAVGLARSGGADGPVVAAIGDSTFFHGGIPALIDAVTSKTDVTVVILNNGTTAMTGGQAYPGTGVTIRGAQAGAVDLEALCRSLGVEQVEVVDPYDVAATHVALERAVKYPGPAVVITNRPCVEAPVKVRDHPFEVSTDACIACQLCMNIGCPSITWTDEFHDGRRKVQIDESTCTGCTVCAQMCPSGAIVPTAEWSR
jgi:indolepyruvate ferredoxin oxidoreductase alpha subunit